MTKLTVHKQSLNDWSVEDEKRTTLAWIERGRDKIFTVKYTGNLCRTAVGVLEITPDFATSFKAAKNKAFLMIDSILNDQE
jgi:hypothetical protein